MGTILASALAAGSVSLLAAAPASAQPSQGDGAVKIVGANGPGRVKDSYIVTLRKGLDATSGAERLARKHNGKVKHVFRSALNGFSVAMSEQAALALAADPDVLRVEANHTVKVSDVQPNPPSWGLDRIDQANLPLDKSFTYYGTASNVHAYIIDTGIRTTHHDFGGRATWGINTSGDSINADCHGHGTHVAGTTGGVTYGVAKDVSLVAVKVLNCEGSGTDETVIAGVDWVTSHAMKPAVANMSLGGGASQSLDDAVTASSAAGITYAVAGGNSNADACGFSPARTPAAITVGATASDDTRASYSNWGSCLDIFAPGSFITSAWNDGDTATNTISGTSMATPHVAGNAALIASVHPTWTPEQIRDEMLADSTDGVVTSPGTGSPTKLLRASTAALPNDFKMSLSSSSGTAKGADSLTTTVDTTLVKGDPQTLSFTVDGLPAGAQAAFTPATVSTGGSTTLTITTSTSTPGGLHPLTVTASGPGISHTAAYDLYVSTAQCQAGQLLADPGFEGTAPAQFGTSAKNKPGSGGDGGGGTLTSAWTASPGVIGAHPDWPAHSGSANAVLGGKGYTATDSMSQKVSLPDGCALYNLDLWLQVKTVESSDGRWDTLKVQVLNADGTSVLKTVKTFDNRDGYGANGYFRHTLDLSAFAGQDITLRFMYAEDWIWATTFVLDDVTLTTV